MTHLLIDNIAMIGIYSIVVLGLVFITGMASIYSMCHAAFFSIGAFTFAGMFSYELTTDLLVALGVALGVATMGSVGLALVALRVSGEAFIVTSFGIQVVAISAIHTWEKVSGGSSGLYGLPFPSVGGVEFVSPVANMWLIVGVAIALFVAAWWVRRAPFGRLMRAMGADEPALRAAGFRPFALKLAAFVVGGILAAIGGVLYVSYLGTAQTADFDLNVSITLLAALLIGGPRSLAGPVIGAFLFMSLPRLLALADMPSSVAGPAQLLVFGVLLVGIMLFFPGGIASIFQRSGQEGRWTRRPGLRKEMS